MGDKEEAFNFSVAGDSEAGERPKHKRKNSLAQLKDFLSKISARKKNSEIQKNNAASKPTSENKIISFGSKGVYVQIK